LQVGTFFCHNRAFHRANLQTNATVDTSCKINPVPICTFFILARALVNDPDLILADEPTGALDSKTSAEVMELLTQLNKQGMTVIVVTHEPDVAAYASRTITFKDGKLLSGGVLK